MSKHQKGFSVLEVVLVLVAVGLVIGAGWYFMHRADNKKPGPNTSTQAVEMKSYTDSAKLYSVSYPGGWTVKQAADCCSGEPKDYTKISRSVTIAPSGKLDVHGYGVNIQADATGAQAKSIQQNWKDNGHDPVSSTVHGYSAQYVKVVFNGSAENYVDDNYLIIHNGASVFVSFREKYYHQYPAEDWSAAPDMGKFNRLLNSITFLN